MKSRTAALALLGAAAGCGGVDPPAPHPERPPAVVGEARSPDARSPFVKAAGVWRCGTGGRVELRVSAGGEATVSAGGRTLGSVAGAQARVNRACERRSPGALPAIVARRVAVGAAFLRCRGPRRVLVDFGAGDLMVRAAPGGRFLLGAAISDVHLDVAGYAGPGCTAR